MLVEFIEVLSGEDKLREVVRICEVALEEGSRGLFWFEEEKDLDFWDRELWVFDKDSFIPHAVWPCQVVDFPFVLSPRPLIWEGFDFLLLPSPKGEKVEPWMRLFPKVVEFADKSELFQLKLSRVRYKNWKQVEGLELKFIPAQRNKSG